MVKEMNRRRAMSRMARWQIILTLAVCILGVAFASPNLLSAKVAETLPTWLPHKQINLGLDLQGGSHVLLEVETDAVVKERLETLQHDVRTRLRVAKPPIGYRGLGVRGDSVVFSVRNAEDVSRAQNSIRGAAIGSTVETLDGGFTISMTEKTLREIRNLSVERSMENLRRRIDEMGMRNATVQRAGVDRIIVKVPGADDANRVYEALPPARLTFHLMCSSHAPATSGSVTPEGCVRIVPWIPNTSPNGSSR